MVSFRYSLYRWSFGGIFVNIGLPFGSGAVVFIISFVGAIIFGIYYSVVNQKVILNTSLLAFAFMMIGYMSYAIVLIRSNYNTPIDENNPEDIMNYVSYLKREQYGSRPLFHGQYFTADIIASDQGDPVYKKGAEKYEIIDHKVIYKYDKKHMTILPRMHSKVLNMKKYEKSQVKKEKPAFIDNLYLCSSTNWEYVFTLFHVEFSGRASDIQDPNWVGLSNAFKELQQN